MNLFDLKAGEWARVHSVDMTHEFGYGESITSIGVVPGEEIFCVSKSKTWIEILLPHSNFGMTKEYAVLVEIGEVRWT